MNPERVITMIGEKSADIGHIPGGVQEFTLEDACHALAGMDVEEDYYCQYVYLLYDDKFDGLSRMVNLYIKRVYPKVGESKKVFSLCKQATKLQRTPNRKISQSELYRNAGLTRSNWQYKYKSIFAEMLSYLSELQSGVLCHIKTKTRE